MAARRLMVSGMAWVSNILYHDHQIRCRVMCPDLDFGIRRPSYRLLRMWLVLSVRKLSRAGVE